MVVVVVEGDCVSGNMLCGQRSSERMANRTVLDRYLATGMANAWRNEKTKFEERANVGRYSKVMVRCATKWKKLLVVGSPVRFRFVTIRKGYSVSRT